MNNFNKLVNQLNDIESKLDEVIKKLNSKSKDTDNLDVSAFDAFKEAGEGKGKQKQAHKPIQTVDDSFDEDGFEEALEMFNKKSPKEMEGLINMVSQMVTKSKRKP